MGDRAKPQRNPCHNANGAGIAADPTLTGVWMTVYSCCVRRTFRFMCRRAMLGARCLASCCPVLRLALPEICHRRSRRHPAFADAGLASTFGPKPVRFSLPRLCLAEARSFADPDCRGWGLSPVPLHSFAARFLTCPVPSRRSRLLASRLAFGRSLLQAFSSWARGQMSPPSRGWKLR